MSTVQWFKLHPLSLVLKLLSVAPMLLISDIAHARVLAPGEVLNIDGTTVPDNYVLNGASTLNTNGGVTFDITVNKATLNLNGTRVEATGTNGVHVNAGTANIIGSTITTDRIGLVVSRDPTNTQGATAIVSGNSTITGETTGATVNAFIAPWTLSSSPKRSACRPPVAQPP